MFSTVMGGQISLFFTPVNGLRSFLVDRSRHRQPFTLLVSSGRPSRPSLVFLRVDPKREEVEGRDDHGGEPTSIGLRLPVHSGTTSGLQLEDPVSTVPLPVSSVNHLFPQL